MYKNIITFIYAIVVAGSTAYCSQDSECGEVVYDDQAGVYVVVNEETGRKWVRCPANQQWDPDECECLGQLFQEADTKYEAAKTLCPPGYFWPDRVEMATVLCNYVEVDSLHEEDHYDSCSECSRCESMFGNDTGRYMLADGTLDSYDGSCWYQAVDFGDGRIWTDSTNTSESHGFMVRCVEDRWAAQDTDEDAGVDADTDVDGDSDADACDGADEWLDQESGLCWQLEAGTGEGEELLTWEEAEQICAEYQGGGWRLPEIQELIGLIRGCQSRDCGVMEATLSHAACTDEYCNEGPVCEPCDKMQGPGEEGCYMDGGLIGGCTFYWSSTELETYAGHAWTVGFHEAKILPYHKLNEMRVRCVRD
jgi:hypothetical protein